MSARGPGTVWLDAADATDRELLGGKCASLAEFLQAGFGVPPAFVVTAAAFGRFMEASGMVERARAARALADPDDVRSLAAASSVMEHAFEAAALPVEIEEEVRGAYAELSHRTGIRDVPVAVRSSGVAEDLAAASFAGQYRTYLWVAGGDEVIRHVKRCWAGLFSAETLSYRPPGAAESDEQRSRGPGLAVAVQQMVPARAAGVMLTLDPVTGDRSKVVIEANWGLGESVVSGEVTPDRFRIDKVTLQTVGEEIADKAVEYRHEPPDGVGPRPVPDERRTIACLEPEVLEELTRLGRRIEAQRGAPQDVEWALDDDGRLHVLQVRPETVWSRREAVPIVAPAQNAVDLVLRQLTGRGA
jgi:pyruvate, water dikinase